MIIKEIKSKSIITKSKLPESDYCLNPYVGCGHGCVYCYARFMKRFTGHNELWGDFIDIKINAPELTKQSVKRIKKNGGVVLIGSVTDAYQPIERKYQLTRKILVELLAEDVPISILTKSALVTRDIDLLSKFSNCSVGFTITTTNEKIRRIFEPGTSSTKMRIEALQKLHYSKINTYLFIGPILPIYTDLSDIFSKAHDFIDSVWGERLNTSYGALSRLQDSLIKNKFDSVDEFVKDAKDDHFWILKKDEFYDLAKKYNLHVTGFYDH